MSWSAASALWARRWRRMKQILVTGDKSEVFNGECGAESGTIPVSAVAPAMLFSEIETQSGRKARRGRRFCPFPARMPRRPQTRRRNEPDSFPCNACRSWTLAVCLCAPLSSVAQQTRADAEKDPVLKAMLTGAGPQHEPVAVEGLSRSRSLSSTALRTWTTTRPRRSLGPARVAAQAPARGAHDGAGGRLQDRQLRRAGRRRVATGGAGRRPHCGAVGAVDGNRPGVQERSGRLCAEAGGAEAGADASPGRRLQQGDAGDLAGRAARS